MNQRKLITGGVLAAAITPRRAREHSIDLGATLELIDFLCEGGVDGIALLGPIGECMHFPLEDRARMLDFAIKRSRAPILANVSHSTLDGATFLAEEAAGSGVAAVLLMPPWNCQYDQDTLREFGLRFADDGPRDLPVFLCDMPADLMATGRFAGSVVQSAHLLGGPVALLENDGAYRQARETGAAGCVSVTACAVPELMVALDRAIRACNRGRVDTLDMRVQEFVSKIEGWPAEVALKEALKQRKIKAGSLAVPLSPQAEGRLADFAAWFKGWVPGVLKESRT